MTRLEMDAFVESESDQTVIAGRSYLVVDYGHTVCTVTLYDLVENRYRLVGRGEGLNTAGPPWFDVTLGLQQAIGQISEASGRKLMSLQGQLIRPSRSDGSGIDYFGATVSFGDPLRIAVAGLLESASIASARKALQATYGQEVACISLDDGRGRPGQIESLISCQPDVILLVGGTDGGADKQVRELLETVTMALELQSEAVRPVVVYGGNANLRSLVLDRLAELTDVHLVGNVRPTFDDEEIGHAISMLAQCYYEIKVAALASSGVLAEWCNTSPINSAHAFGGIAEYLAAAVRGRVLGIDVGSDQVTLISAVAGQVDLLVHTDMGLGRPVRQLLASHQKIELDDSPDENGRPVPLVDYILDKSAHPGALPLTTRAAQVELALASELVRQAVADAAATWSWPADGFAPSFHTLFIRGRVFSNASSAQDALVAALDALQPRGIFKVVADAHGILPAMGLLAAEDPDMVVQILSGKDLDLWAWVVAPTGRARQGDTVLTVSMQAASQNVVEAEVPFGALEVLPMPLGERIEVDLKPAAGIDIGAGDGQSRQLTLSGSILGLLIDGRIKKPAR